MSELADRTHAEIEALRATPGAFAEWDRRVQDICFCIGWVKTAGEATERKAEGHFKQAIEVADAYAAEVRRRYEADVIARGLKAMGVPAEAVDNAIREALGVEP